MCEFLPRNTRPAVRSTPADTWAQRDRRTVVGAMSSYAVAFAAALPLPETKGFDLTDND
jgi:hypothetical protein